MSNPTQSVKRAKSTMMKNSRAVVFGVTKNLNFALGTMLIGFVKHNPDFDGDFVVFYEDISDDQKAVLLNIYPQIKFKKLTIDMVQTHLASSGVEKSAVQKIITRYSYFYFAKFELPGLLDEYEKVIWLDVDMLVRAPLHQVWDFKDFCWRPVRRSIEDKYKNITAKLPANLIKRPYSSPNGGLIGISQKPNISAKIGTSQLYHWFANIHRYAYTISADELAFFLLASSVNANVTLLDQSFNFPSATKGVDKAKIVHAIGKDKFWNNSALKVAYPDWSLWYTAWIAAGGEEYVGDVKSDHFSLDTPDRIVIAARHQPYWSRFFNELYQTLPKGVIPDIITYRNFWQILFQAFPRALLHIEVTRMENDFRVGVHIESDALNDKHFIEEVDALFAASGIFTRFQRSYGICWELDVQEENVTRTILICAEMILGNSNIMLRPRIWSLK